MEGVNNDDAETAMWVERLEECVAENEQRDYGNEEVHRDHQGQVLALDLPIAPAGTKEEPDPWPLLILAMRSDSECSPCRIRFWRSWG